MAAGLVRSSSPPSEWEIGHELDTSIRGSEDLVIPDLAGRVTIGVPREQRVDGLFLAPHSATWDAEGNLYVMDWNALGRVNKLRRVGER